MSNPDAVSGSPQSSHNSHVSPEPVKTTAAPVEKPVEKPAEPAAPADAASSTTKNAATGAARTPPPPSSRARAPAGKSRSPSGDHPFFDPVAYGNGPDDSVTDTSENAAVTHHTTTIGGRKINYTATAGHLVTVDPSSSLPSAKLFYVAFTEDAQKEESRPVTFFYNGGPGSSSVFVLLGSFAPRRIKTSMPSFTPPAPYAMEDNPDSLLDKSDLVFVNPVGTGYSAAIAPHKNRDFWGVDQDADSLKQFIKRFLTKNNRWNSPKFLFGESYGTARSCVLAYRLHEDGVDLNGITLQSSILDYTQAGNPVGALPTAAADAWYHKKLGIAPRPTDLGAFAEEVAQFARTDYIAALRKFPTTDSSIVEKLSEYTGIDKTTLLAWSLDIAAYDSRGNSLFLTSLLKSKGLALGEYDGRVTAIETGIAGKIDPNSGGNDPTMTAVTGVYTTMWNVYLNEQLKFTSDSSFTDLNDQAFQNWDFGHIDPTGAQKGLDAKGNVILYTAGDLAAVMALNTDLKVLSANGFYDYVTPFYQTVLDLQQMPLVSQQVRQNLSARFYPSGHMVYLDGGSRTALKADLASMYEAAVSNGEAMSRIRALQARRAS
ncbi:peptidase S1 [Paraburkholderia sp.]|uniref:S10 family peptidase n=1 Tax=Paraburkholderia sp. TaxID=1926495 RepID=UPI00238CFEF5|nr:peptidase S1 [Paraburkholderia sp.]MDE1181112.1 peptidase S1 [Paraburkholderia sp.]